MDLVVIGASGQTGRLVVERAAAEGHRVTAAAREPDKVGVDHPRVSTVKADATDPDEVREVIRGHDAVISCLGAPGYTKDEVTIYSKGTGTIVEAMTELRVPRLVCVSTTGVTHEAPAHETWFYRTVVMPALLRMGRTGYEDNARMEEIVRTSGLSATIVRAGGLFDPEGHSTSYEIRDPEDTGRFTARADLADALVYLAEHDPEEISTVGVFSTSGTPRLRDVLLREAFGRATR